MLLRGRGEAPLWLVSMKRWLAEAKDPVRHATQSDSNAISFRASFDCLESRTASSHGLPRRPRTGRQSNNNRGARNNPRDGLRERPAYFRPTGIRPISTLLAEKRAGLAALVALVHRGECRFDVSPEPV